MQTAGKMIPCFGNVSTYFLRVLLSISKVQQSTRWGLKLHILTQRRQLSVRLIHSCDSGLASKTHCSAVSHDAPLLHRGDAMLELKIIKQYYYY